MADENITTADVKVHPGDWVLFRAGLSTIAVDLRQVDKATPKLVKFRGSWPKQCSRVAVVAAFADKDTAEKARNAIAGVSGEYTRRRRLADDDRSKRVTEALIAANKQVAAILARLSGAVA